MTDRIGQQLGNYRLVLLLGKGGFAEVYLGEHVHLRTPVAIKVLQTKMLDANLEDFLGEARTIARLVHPNIVRVLDFGVDSDTAFLVMDYASNGTLRQRYPKGTQIELMTVVSYIKQVTDALQYAHDERVTHRDIKPENILLGRKNEVLLSDFGIALMTQSSRYQNTQDVMGTIAYMAPEQIQGKPRPASDQYSLGVVVYEWLSGERPFRGSFTELCAQHMFVPPPSLRARISTISTDVEQVVMTALAKDAYKRFPTVQAFATALEQANISNRSTSIALQTNPPPTSADHSPHSTMFSTLPAESPSLEKKPETVSSDEKHTAIKDSEGKVNVWSISKRQMVAMILGAFLYGGLTYCINSLLLHNSNFFESVYLSFTGGTFGAISVSNLLIGAAFLLPLFFGIAFGPWVGLFTGLVGSLMGNYLTLWIFQAGGLYSFDNASSPQPANTFHKYLLGNPPVALDRYGSNWQWYIGVSLIGFIAGLALLRTKGRYNDAHAITIANIIAAIAAIVGIGFITISDIWKWQFAAGDALGEFLSLALPTVIMSLILMPKLLRSSKEGVERLISKLLRNSKTASKPVKQT